MVVLKQLCEDVGRVGSPLWVDDPCVVVESREGVRGRLEKIPVGAVDEDDPPGLDNAPLLPAELRLGDSTAVEAAFEVTTLSGCRIG